MNKYKCKHCGKVVERDSDEQWVNSYCDKTDKNVRLIKIPDNTKKYRGGITQYDNTE